MGLLSKVEATLKITPEELKAVIKKLVEDEQPGFNVKRVDLEVGTEYVGMRGEAMTVFKGVNVQLTPKER